MGVALWIVVVLLLLVVGAAWALLVQFAAQQGRIMLRLESLEERLRPDDDTGVCGGTLEEASQELALGTAIPSLTLRNLEGAPIALDDFHGRRLLLVNWSPSCGFCELIARDLAKLHGALRKRNTDLVLLASGDVTANRRLARSHHLECPVVLKDSNGSMDVFGSVGTPAAYLIDEQGRVASERALGSEEVPALAREAAARPRLRSLTGSRIRRDGLPPGSRAPDFKLRAVNDGSNVALGDYRGRRLLLVFSDPHCAPCEELAPELARMHREIADDALAVVMIGRGEPEENRRKCEQHGLHFPVVVQRGSKVSKEYGIFSWPVAFLVDEDGLIADKVAIGPEAILALARRGMRAGEEAPMEV